MGSVFSLPLGQCFGVEMAMCSKIFYGLADHLDIGVPTVAVWMGEKEELYLFYVDHYDFGGGHFGP